MHRVRFAGGLADGSTTAALSCPNGWQSTRLNSTHGECLRLFFVVADWDTAQNTCAAHGARLAQIVSEGENRAAALLLKESNTVSAWTDGSKLGAFTSWDTGEPDQVSSENCVMIFPYGGWADDSCTESKAFLCSMPTNPSSASAGQMLGCQGGYWQMGTAHRSPGLPLTVVRSASPHRAEL